MKPAALLWWRLVLLWLSVLALVSRHPSCYVGCTEQLEEATSLPAQDIVSQEEQSENTATAEESWVSHVHSLSEDELMAAGQRPDEDLDTRALVEEDEDVEQVPESAMRAEEPAAEVKLEAETETDDAAAAEAAAAGEPEPDAQLPDTPPPPTVTQDQQPAASSEPSPASPAPSGATAATAGDATPDSADASSISASQQDQTLSSGSDHVESDTPPPEPSDEHLATTDCEAGEANPYDDASPPVVLENTSNAHIAGTKTHADPAMSPPPARSTDSLGGNTSHMLKEKALSTPVAAETESSTAQVPVLSSKDPEDIPTFDEWKRKVMEVENEKTQATHTSSNGASVPVKKVQKNFNNNYASVECGAKILGSNPEAKSTSAILMENMDMYMLNPCSNKIWFIIELCEPIQLKQLDIANFELFSSTPKDFLVSISDRYPTNKWLKLGTFHGRDERTVQSFPLDEHLYAKYVKMFTKYIKVELISHFGSEHFCPLSLIRVFGTSMVEEYEEIADPSERAEDQDDDLDYPPGYALGEIKSSKNLIGSAKDAILNMVNTAVNVLGGSSEMQGNASFQEVNMTEPPLQTEANTEAAGAATTIAPMPDAEEVEILVDSDFPATEAPPPDLPTPELPVTESTELELPPVEDSIVTPLPADEDESISSTITLLGEEEDEDEESKEEREAKEKRQHESSDCCGPLSFSSQPSSSTFCSCSSSLQEYLMQQCSTQLSKQRKPQIPESKATITPHPYLPALKLPFSPPASPVTQPPHTDINQPQDKELDPGSAESAVGPSEVPLIPGNVSEPQTGSVSEPPVLEPSQTSSLPKPSATESPAAKSTPAAQLPQHSSKGLPKEPRPDRSQDEQAAERQGGTTVSPSVSVPVDRPSGSATVEHVSVPPTDDKPKMDFGQSGQDPPTQATEYAEPAHTSQPSTASEPQPVPPATPESYSPAPEELLPAPPTASEPDPSEGLSATATESKVVDDFTEDMIFTSTIGQLPRPSSTSPPSSSSSPTHSEFYAELNNMTEQGNGNQVHGSSLKESVFMRLNNRIKALEMNMSLSGRYLEQLSQRYRKQMEEMQKAFNKTIIKLQNTARMAEEQDLRQTESIQSLQGQLENITQLVLNLSVRVSQLQSDVSDRQSYLLASLTLCLFLGLVLCANRCGASADIEPPALLAEPEPPEESSSYSNCERQFASCDDTWLKRRASYPLLHSDSLQIPTTEGPESLPTVETQRFSPANRKKRRAKVKPREGVETLKAASLPTPDLANGFAVCNGLPHAANPAHRLLHAAFKDSPSEGSSEGGSSSHSDDPSFCGIATIATACTRLCDGLPPPRTKAEKRALRRRRPRPGPSVVDLLQAPRRDKIDYMPVPSTLQDLRSNELSSGTFGANTALSGPA